MTILRSEVFVGQDCDDAAQVVCLFSNWLSNIWRGRVDVDWRDPIALAAAIIARAECGDANDGGDGPISGLTSRGGVARFLRFMAATGRADHPVVAALSSPQANAHALALVSLSKRAVRAYASQFSPSLDPSLATQREVTDVVLRCAQLRGYAQRKASWLRGGHNQVIAQLDTSLAPAGWQIDGTLRGDGLDLCFVRAPTGALFRVELSYVERDGAMRRLSEVRGLQAEDMTLRDFVAGISFAGHPLQVTLDESRRRELLCNRSVEAALRLNGHAAAADFVVAMRELLAEATPAGALVDVSRAAMRRGARV